MSTDFRRVRAITGAVDDRRDSRIIIYLYVFVLHVFYRKRSAFVTIYFLFYVHTVFRSTSLKCLLCNSKRHALNARDSINRPCRRSKSAKTHKNCSGNFTRSPLLETLFLCLSNSLRQPDLRSCVRAVGRGRPKLLPGTRASVII